MIGYKLFEIYTQFSLTPPPQTGFASPDLVSKVRMSGNVFPFFHMLTSRAHKHLHLYLILKFAVQHKNLGNWRRQGKSTYRR